ncbi:MAG: hypothetical protein FWG75_06170 [Cystobacterineae bacterium]|nr:hypothetical protein [Cystobacterineae bacterium]
MYYWGRAFFNPIPFPLMRLRPSALCAAALLWAVVSACYMPALPSTPPKEEEGLFLKNVHFYNVEGKQLQLLGKLSEVRFLPQQQLLKSRQATLLWVPEQFHFYAERLNIHLQSQEAWAFVRWTLQTQENGFGEGTTAYGHKDKLGNIFAQTQAPLRLWQEENTLEAQSATCEKKTKSCEFKGAVKTHLSKPLSPAKPPPEGRP